MRILVVSQYYWPENFRINDICAGLVERGHEVEVLTSLPNVPQGRFYEGYGWFRRGPKEHNGVRIERVGVIARGRGGTLRWVLNCASFALGSLFHLPKLMARRYDAVFVFNNSPVSVILPAKIMAGLKRIPNVIFVLDIWPESMFLLLGQREDGRETPARRVSRAVSRWLYRSGDLLLVSSRGFVPKLEAMNLGGKPIEYFPNYAEPMSGAAGSGAVSREQLGLKKKDFVVGFAGNIGRAQGLDKLVEAAALADSRARYLIVGDGSELPGVKARVAEAGLADRFIFTGWVDSALVAGYLALCDALLVSLEDSGVLNLTVPAKLQTYMQAARPVIAFINGAGAEAVAAAGCGVVAPAGDAEGLRGALDIIIAAPKRALGAMGRQGKKYCEAYYNRERILDELVRHLEAAVAGNTRRKKRAPVPLPAPGDKREKTQRGRGKSMRVLVIIPAYNEAETIERVVADLRLTQPGYDYVVVNDCSTDTTETVLKINGFNYINVPVNLGIGGGVQTGYRYAVANGYDIAVQMDGDGQHDPAYLRAIVEPVERGEVDLCVGSRFLTGEGFQTSALRRMGIVFLSWLIRLLCGTRVSDVTSGFRACSRPLAEFYAAHYAQDYPEPEAIVTAVTAGFRMAEAPVKMRERQGGVSSISPMRSVYYMIKVSLSLVLNRLIGKRR